MPAKGRAFRMLIAHLDGDGHQVADLFNEDPAGTLAALVLLAEHFGTRLHGRSQLRDLLTRGAIFTDLAEIEAEVTHGA